MTRTAYRQAGHKPLRIEPWRDPPPPGWRLVPDKPTEEWIENMKKHTAYPSTGRAIELMLRCAPTYKPEE